MNFLKRGGFNERIVALCQALIEVNIEKFNYGRVDLEVLGISLKMDGCLVRGFK